MKPSLFCRGAVACCILASGKFLSGQEVLPIDQVEFFENGNSVRAMQFEAKEGMFYRIQHSQDLGDWEEFFSIDGFGDTARFPFVVIEPASGGGGSLPGGNSPTNWIVLSMAKVNGGGVLLSWRSKVSGSAIQHHVPSLTMDTAWTGTPLFHSVYDDYGWFILANMDGVDVPSGLPGLGLEDETLVTEFIDDFSVIETDMVTGNTGQATFAPPPPGSQGCFRVTEEHADKDRDGLVDTLEQTPRSEGGTETDPFNCDSDGDGVDDGAEVAQGYDPNDPQSTPDTGPDAGQSGGGGQGGGGILVTPGGAQVVEVGFHGVLDSYHELTSDDQKVNYRDPHWKLGSHNFPVSYVRNSRLALSGRFVIGILDPPENPKVSATLPNGIELQPTELEPVDGSDFLWELPKTPCNQGELPGTIRYYCAQNDLNPSTQQAYERFTVAWEILLPGAEVPDPAGFTNHTVYVTRGIPVGRILGLGIGEPIRQESIFNISCRNADGAIEPAATSSEIAKKIYGEFLDRSVARVIPTTGLRRTESLSYWGDFDDDGLPHSIAETSKSAKELIASENGNGNCQAWAKLFLESLKIQSYSVDLMAVEPTSAYPGFPDESSFVVRNNFIGDPISSEPDPYQWIHGQNLVSNVPGLQLGIPGQGGSEPAKFFQVHYVVEFEESLFDPSYGVPVIAGENRVKMYEDQAIEYFGYSEEVGGITEFHMRPNNTEQGSSAEVQLVPSGG